MKGQSKQVFIKNDFDWNPQEFRFLKENDVFSFDKEQIFTASCDAYIVENEGSWSILTVNKEMERFYEERKKERDKLFGII